MQKKPIILSAAIALAAGSLAIGGTFALFTSEATNEIAATAGKVHITPAMKLTAATSGEDAKDVKVDDTHATVIMAKLVSTPFWGL
jgi:predicted ribosomally synthesized peptide with SipW-like signal peptide